MLELLSLVACYLTYAAFHFQLVSEFWFSMAFLDSSTLLINRLCSAFLAITFESAPKLDD